ncbi:MAG: MFS transporter [Lewinellaceae bacterium]|nr:MFS transporter [Lewinellaceae bacterium]
MHPPVSPDAPLYTRAFMLLCLSHALFAGSFNMMIPELPAYLTSLGGAEHKGWIIALFTITAGVSRPFSGKLADTIGRIPVMYLGVFACVVCGMLYPALAFVNGFLALRFFHGFSTGFKPTGTSAYVADIVPMHRRGEAMGVLGICFSLGVSASPPLGSWMAGVWSLNTVFYASSVLAAVSMFVMAGLRETLPEKQPFRLGLLRVTRDDIYDPQAIPAAIVMILCYGSYGIILTLAPDLTDGVGVTNRGTVFMLFTLASVSTRLFAGKISDQRGREPVLKVSALLIALSMLAFACTTTPAMLYLSAVLFGLGNGVFSPAINAWTVDLGDPQRKGRSMATMYIALEIAIGLGAAVSGWYFASQMDRMPVVFYAAAGMSLLSFFYLLGRKRIDRLLGVAGA